MVKRVPDRVLDVAVCDLDVGQVSADVAEVAHTQILDVGVPIGRIGGVERNAIRTASGPPAAPRGRNRGGRIGCADQPGINRLGEIPVGHPIADRACSWAVLPWRALSDGRQWRLATVATVAVARLMPIRCEITNKYIGSAGSRLVGSLAHHIEPAGPERFDRGLRWDRSDGA